LAIRQILGTYHHSVIVGTMVEAAASEIGANPLLAKVCGYYHDIGKIKKPLYFIENQINGMNKHDKLAPSMSSLILISHIKDGVEIARKNKLGQGIIDTIRQSHGTSLISYFYEKATRQKGENAVKIDNFRYPGPKPQTREAGLVMLSDMVEAASRTLANPTPSKIQGLVQNLINKAFSDGQLDDCELTLKDLHKIAKSFYKTLSGIHHHRIEYPEKPLLGNGKGKNGDPVRQQTKQVQDISGKNTYFNRYGSTNVIAFPMRTGQFNNIAPQLLGDVVISIETAAREGEIAGMSMEERFTQLLVHGILHLLGYDHEKNKKQAYKMEKKSDEILKLIKI